MKRNDMTQKENLLFIECALVFAFLLVPPLFSTVPFTLPPKPEGLYAQCVFCFYTVYAAAYEEVLYRLYTPNRLNCIYTSYIEPRLQKNLPAAESCSENTIDLPQSSFPCICCENNTEAFFELCLTEFPALLLFTLAHRYLGFSSMLFAAGAGIVFRTAYLKLKQVFHPAVSIALVAAVHGLWNIGVYYYLWENTITRVISRLYGLSANAISFTFSELYTAISLA